MPVHIAPAIRAREEAAEAAGLEVALTSDGVVTELSQEALGKKGKITHPVTYNFNGKTYKQ